MASQDASLWTTGYRRMRLAVLDRDLWLCQIHGPTCTHWATEVDHITARVFDFLGARSPTSRTSQCLSLFGPNRTDRD